MLSGPKMTNPMRLIVLAKPIFAGSVCFSIELSDPVASNALALQHAVRLYLGIIVFLFGRKKKRGVTKMDISKHILLSFFGDGPDINVILVSATHPSLFIATE